MSGLGVDSKVRVKKEASYGAKPASGFTEHPIVSEGVNLEIEDEESPEITGGVAVEDLFETKRAVAGPINIVGRYTHLDPWLYGVMGAVAETTPGGGTLSRQKIYTPGSTLPSWSLEEIVGDIPTGKAFSYVGNFWNKLEITFNDRGFMRLAIEVIGKDDISVDAGDTPATGPVLITDKAPILMKQATAWDMGTGAPTDYCVKSGRITIDRGLNNDDLCIGSSTPIQPSLLEKMKVDGEFVIKFKDRLIYNDYRNRVEGVIDLIFIGAIIEGIIPYTFETSCNRVLYGAPGGKAFIDNPGQLTARVPFRTIGNAGSGMTMQPIAFKVINKILIASL